MNAVDNASQRNAAASHGDSGDIGLAHPRSGNAIDLHLKRGSDLVCTAGRVNDDGGPLPDVPVEPSLAKSSVAPQPSRPVISAKDLLQAAVADDPHGKTPANKTDQSLQGEPQHRQ